MAEANGDLFDESEELHEEMEASLHENALQPLLEEACPLQPPQTEEALIPSQFAEAHSSSNSDASFSTAPAEEAMEASLHEHALQPPLEEACPLQPLQIEDALIPSQFAEAHSSSNSNSSSSIDPAEFSSPDNARRIGKDVAEGNEDSPLMKQLCGICLEEKNGSEIFDNKVCSHRFCSTCIIQHIRTKLQEKLVSISCPEPDCSAQLTPEQCQAILPKQTFEEWCLALAKADAPLSEKFYCPFRDCPALLSKDIVPDEIGCSDGAAAAAVIKESECPECRRLYCGQCGGQWHAGLDCSEFQKLSDSDKENSDLMLFKIAKENEWQRCGNCKYIIERTCGCCHMICRRTHLPHTGCKNTPLGATSGKQSYLLFSHRLENLLTNFPWLCTSYLNTTQKKYYFSLHLAVQYRKLKRHVNVFKAQGELKQIAVGGVSDVVTSSVINVEQS